MIDAKAIPNGDGASLAIPFVPMRARLFTHREFLIRGARDGELLTLGVVVTTTAAWNTYAWSDDPKWRSWSFAGGFLTAAWRIAF